MISQYAKKGSGVLVSGRLDQRSFEGKDGVKRSRVEIVVEDFNFVSTPREGGNGGGNYSASNYGASATTDSTIPNDIPDDVPEGEIDLSEVPF